MTHPTKQQRRSSKEILDQLRKDAELEEIQGALRATPGPDYSLPQGDLLALTFLLSEHPEWWDHPCFCAECRSCADG